MGIGELLDRIREQYLTQFTAAIETLGQQRDVQVLSEVALRDQGGCAVAEGTLGLPMRLDVVVQSSETGVEQFSVDSDRLLRFPPIRFTWPEGLAITLGPFPWDSLRVRIPNADGIIDYAPVVGWFRQWFREDEDGAGELIGVVHFLSDPEVVGGEVRFTADLGSAPVDAFEELLDALVALGAKEVIIGEAADAERTRAGSDAGGGGM